jgi:hypothetical protein
MRSFGRCPQIDITIQSPNGRGEEEGYFLDRERLPMIWDGLEEQLNVYVSV